MSVPGLLIRPPSPCGLRRTAFLLSLSRKGEGWWSWSGSNRRPPECKSGALPAELQPRWFSLSRPIEREARQASSPTLTSFLMNLSGEVRTVWTGTAATYFCASLAERPSVTPATFSLRKEVIQPQVLLRLPCYDFTPIMSHTLGRCLPCGLACRLLVQPTFVM